MITNMRAPHRGLISAVLSVSALTCVVTLSTAASAQDKTAAELRTDAKAALAAGDVPSACVLFEQGYQATKKAAPGDPGPKPEELLFELAECHEKQGYASLAGNEYAEVAQLGGANAAEAKTRAEKIDRTFGPWRPCSAGSAPSQPPCGSRSCARRASNRSLRR